MENTEAQSIKSMEEIESDFSNFGIRFRQDQTNVFKDSLTKKNIKDKNDSISNNNKEIKT